MFWLIGSLKEKMGKSVHKAILLRAAKTENFIKEFTDEKGGHLVFAGDPRKKFHVVGSHFFGNNEKIWQTKEKAYILNLDNECYTRGETHVQFINADTGDSLNMTGLVEAAEHPEILKRMVSVGHIKTFAEHVKGMNPQIVWLLIGFVIGFFICLPFGGIIMQKISGLGGQIALALL